MKKIKYISCALIIAGTVLFLLRILQRESVHRPERDSFGRTIENRRNGTTKGSRSNHAIALGYSGSLQSHASLLEELFHVMREYPEQLTNPDSPEQRLVDSIIIAQGLMASRVPQAWQFLLSATEEQYWETLLPGSDKARVACRRLIRGRVITAIGLSDHPAAKTTLDNLASRPAEALKGVAGSVVDAYFYIDQIKTKGQREVVNQMNNPNENAYIMIDWMKATPEGRRWSRWLDNYYESISSKQRPPSGGEAP